MSYSTYEETYASYDDAAKANMVGPERRIPEYMPRSAQNIRARWDYESNETWVHWRAPTEDLRSMANLCKPLEPRHVVYPRDARYGPPGWWPIALRAGSMQRDPSYSLFRCRSNGGTAVKFESGEVYGWYLG